MGKGHCAGALAEKSWAVVGVSENREGFAFKIYDALKRQGYTAYAVNPKLAAVYGDPCYPGLASLPSVPAVVNVVVRPDIGLKVLEEAARLGVGYAWLQPGANAPQVASRGEELGLKVIADACAWLELTK